MKKSIKLTALLLSVMLFIGLMPVAVFAYGSADSRLFVTHIDASCSQEGAGVIITPNSGETVAGKSTDFAWWMLFVFEWDEDDYCYKMTAKHTNMGTAKTTTEIPENGFVYAINTGNNYPALYASTGNESYKDKPNYQTQNILDSYNYAKDLAVGTKAYVYNADLLNSAIDTNGTDWYKPEFVSNSYIKIGAPDDTGTLYDPNNAEEILFQYTLDITHINTDGLSNGMSIIFTGDYGPDIRYNGTVPSIQNYAWWKTAVFEWNDIEECYDVTSISLAIGNNYPKQPLIPENGFVLAVAEGSEITNAVSANMEKLKLGAKAYVYGADLGAGTITTSAKICMNLPDEELTEYTPVLSGTRLNPPVFTNADAKRTTITDAGFTIEWGAVEGAELYAAGICDSTYVNDGELMIGSPTEETSFYINGAWLEVGKSYTVTVYAFANDRITSRISRAKLVVISAEAFESSLRDKTIVAFGDSLTARTGWVDMLGGRFGSDVINSGVGGDNTNAGKSRFNQDVLAYEPDIVIVNFGMNDQAHVITQDRPNVSLEVYTANLEYFAQTLTAEGIDVIFATPNAVCTDSGYYVPGAYNLNYGSENMLAFCEAMRKTALKYGCGLVDINYECSFEDLTQFTSAGDGIHQSSYGHQRYAELIGDYLAAVYDGKSPASVEVCFVDEFGASIAESVVLSGATGANILVPGIDIDGYTIITPPQEHTLSATAGSLTFEYAATAQTIELTEGSGFIIDGDRIYLNGTSLTSEDVLAEIATSGVVCQPNSGSHVGTGSKLLLMNGDTVVSELTVILLGDVDGDGVVGSKDFLRIKRHFLGTYTLTDEYYTAGDIDQGGAINSADYLKVKRHFLGTYDIYNQ